METVEKYIDVNIPVRSVYNQWTQFEEFPKFMENIESVEQLDEIIDRVVAEKRSYAGAGRSIT